jgi:hypothetical protein
MLRRGPADPGGRPRRAHLGTGGVWSAAVLWLREGAGSTGRDHRRGPWRTGSGEVCDRGGMMRQSSRPATTSAVNGIRPLRATRVHHVTGTETLGGVEARVVGQGGRADRKRTLTAAFDAQRKSRLRAPPPPRLPQVRDCSTLPRVRSLLRFLKSARVAVSEPGCCFGRIANRAPASARRRRLLLRRRCGRVDEALLVHSECPHVREPAPPPSRLSVVGDAGVPVGASGQEPASPVSVARSRAVICGRRAMRTPGNPDGRWRRVGRARCRIAL